MALRLDRLSKFTVGAIFALFVVYAAKIFSVAWSVGPWIDELYTLHAINLPWLDMLLERYRRGHPPVYFTLEKLVWQSTQSLLFPPEFRLRLLSLAAWLAALACFAILARRLFSSRTAILATSIFAFSNIASLHAANARMYALALLFSVGHIFATIKLSHDAKDSKKWWGLYVFSTIAGVNTSPSFLLLSLGTSVGFWWTSRERNRAYLLALATSAIALTYYLPALYFYLVTPSQLGPVSKHVSRIGYAIPALLTGLGRGKVPDSGGLQWFSFIVSLFAGLAILLLAARSWKLTQPWFRCVFVAFATPFVILLGGALLSTIPPLGFLRVGTDRYLIVFVPAGALIAAEVFERRLQSLSSIFAVLIGLLAVLNTSNNENKEGRLFKKEIISLCNHVAPQMVTIICPPEIVEGVQLYCPQLKPAATFGINSLCPTTLSGVIDEGTSSGGILLIYYRGHVPEVIQKCRDAFSTVTLLSRRVYGSDRDPLFAVCLFSEPRQRVP